VVTATSSAAATASAGAAGAPGDAPPSDSPVPAPSAPAEVPLLLRDDLLRFVADADSQCRTIIEHHEARLAPGAIVSNQSFT